MGLGRPLSAPIPRIILRLELGRKRSVRCWSLNYTKPTRRQYSYAFARSMKARSRRVTVDPDAVICNARQPTGYGIEAVTYKENEQIASNKPNSEELAHKCVMSLANWDHRAVS